MLCPTCKPLYQVRCGQGTGVVARLPSTKLSQDAQGRARLTLPYQGQWRSNMIHMIPFQIPPSRLQELTGEFDL